MPQTRTTDSRIHREQIRQLYEQSPVATAGAVSAAVIMGALLLLDSVSAWRIGAWVSASVTVTLIRQAMTRSYRKNGITPETALLWKRNFLILVAISGIIWGSAGVFLFPRQDIIYQMLVVIVLLAMVAGAVGTFSVILTVYLTYTIPTLLPLAANLFSIGDVLHYGMATLVLLYFVFMTLTAYYLHRQTRTALELRFKNLDLVKYLEAAGQKTEAVNRSLKNEIAERTRAEAALQAYRKDLENQVSERTAELQRTNRELRNEIEERNRTASAFIASEEKYRLLVENANDAICILQNGTIAFHNRRAETMFGFSEHELRKKTYFELIHPDDLPRAEAIYRQRRQQQPIAPEHIFRLLHKDGSTIWVQVNAVALKWGGEMATQCIIRDITKQKHLEAQLLQSQKMEAIGKLAGGIAHDINNILGGIQGNISLLQIGMDRNDPNCQKILDIESYIRSGSGLTRQLLDFAHPEDPEIKSADINALLENTVNMFCRTRKEIRVSLAFKNPLKTVAIDPGQMEQVILNLLVNAWHAMPDGGSLDIRAENITMDPIEATALGLEPGPFVRIAFTDSGAGIEEAILPKIFEPFFSTKPKEAGTGLGLSTVYTIIKNHNGHITVYSRPGTGTTFHIYLPVNDTAVVQGTAEEEPVSCGNEVVLIVDDEPEILEIGKQMLAVIGYRVTAAGTGEEAVETFKARRDIDLVILDMIMPDMDGEAVFDRLRAIDPEIRVLLSSGYSKSGQADKILKKGCNGFIQKPYNLQTLNRKIRQVLDQQ